MTKEILIADPDKAVQEDFQRFFDAADYRLVFSENGEDALLRARIFKPDLIFAGTALGEENGLELCETLKNDPEFENVPIVLISNIFEKFSDEDRKRVRADGVISKPLHEDEVRNLVERFTEEEIVAGREERDLKDTGEWKSFAKITEEEDEEIIELVDVVEEQEPRMNINDFIAKAKEEPLGEITSLESWEKLRDEEKHLEKASILSLDEKGIKGEEAGLEAGKEVPRGQVSSEEELFEKIELEEILKKVEELKPSVEDEWAAYQEEVEVLGDRKPVQAEATEKYPGLEEFVTPRKEAEESPIKEESEPIFFEELIQEVPVEAAPVERMIKRKEWEELREEEFPEELLEESLLEEDLGVREAPQKIEPQPVVVEKIEEEKAPQIWEEKRIAPLERVVDKSLEDAISKGIQEMVGDFVTKLLPEMTQHIMNLTLERIEKMVKEVVPDLAEKAIQEEIRRLQQGEKD